MKIPFGYGFCNIQFWGNTMPDGLPKGVNFKIDHSSTYEVVEMADNWMSLARSNEKDIYGYHFNFDLKLIDYALESGSTQENLANFLYYYNINTAKDKRFLVYPYSDASGFFSFVDRGKVKYEVIAIEYPSMTNIAEHVSKGQYLNLKLTTRAMLDKDAYNYLIYRETSDGSWAKLPVAGTINQLNSASQYGNGRSLGVPISNMITDANDAGFKDGDIGNWTAYSDGSGTAIYVADSPAAGDKVAKVTVDGGGDAGTYSGMSLATTEIDTFVDGTTYRIRMRIYIPSSNNNFTKISVLPTGMTWTKVSETLATLTTEDTWQTVEAIYTAGADVTGAISIKGESTTGNDFYYIDDIEITTY